MIVIYVNSYLKSSQRKLAAYSERCRADNCRSIPNSGQDRTLNPTLRLHISIIYNLKGHGNEILPL
jgi:hypothetical protein